MKGYGGEIITNPIEATMQMSSSTSVRSYITLRRQDIIASINLDKSGITDSRLTRIKQDITTSLHIINTFSTLDNNIQGVCGANPGDRACAPPYV